MNDKTEAHEKLAGELLPTSPQEPLGGDVSDVEVKLPPEDFMPDTGPYEVTWTDEEWKPPGKGAKAAKRKGVVEDGREVMVYENGSIKEVETGHFLKPGHTFATPGMATKAINARWEQAREAAIEGLIAAYMESGSMMPPKSGNSLEMAAWAAIVASRAAIAMDRERGREGTDAARFVGQAAGLLAGKNEGQGQDSGSMRWELTGRVALEALKMLEERNKKE